MDELQQRYDAVRNILRLEERKARVHELEALTSDPALWEDQSRAVTLMAELAEEKKIIAQVEDAGALLELAREADFSPADRHQVETDIQALEQYALLSGPHDAASAILTIHAGTGGVDAQDWAEMLLRMYLRYVESGTSEAAEERTLSIDRRGWQVAVVELARGEEAGIKRAVLEIRGRHAYGLLKNEAGVHRLVRLSPFNAKNLRQTSFALVEVLPEIEQSHRVTVDEKELRIDVFRSGGHGGQSVNTTDSAVRVTHVPTGLTVTVQNERSQHQNKATALTILQSKLMRLQEVKNAEERAMLKGEFREGSWGNQIRSYVLQPYQMVKDHRTEQESANIQEVLDGNLKLFIESCLRQPQPAEAADPAGPDLSYT
jgi:peptide chain release factor 2